MKTPKLKMETLLNSLPNDNEEKLLYIDKVKKYSSECGCSLGAQFFIASAGIFIVYFFLSIDFDLANMLIKTLLGILFIFASSVAGKLIGIGMARVKLALLHKLLIAKYRIQGE